jgi:hypothetical protein
LATVGAILVLICAREKPQRPPSASADKPTIKLDFKKELKGLL